ncbi:flippase [Desulfosporosinus meridiei]|uniref:Membrane protein involved in the export of O-antigen and teichoic acid n=1 Tax=Desulfosporosinus meridiei (strain ATCC BAA-275 / DSM 13257 / KCTC 12902 / NCIMB 13706 / S10) TaxID=768704 RepID=J7J5C4_DESMD|nr:flippase [Desulfosporosinus meridiei]AFQ46146.1 membrane protein involved in the export of O-antigen and teichoic acid [Desulfosporosinus meridiei DSM 13257]
MSFVRNSFLTLFGTIGRVAFSMITQIVISRVLGPVGKGLYAFLVQIPTVLVPLCSLGLNYANTYYIAKNPEDGKKAVGSSLGMAALLGGFMVVVVGIAYQFLKNGYMQAVTPLQLGLILIAIPFGLLNLYWLSVLWGMDYIGKYNLALLVQFIVLSAGVSIAALWGGLTVTMGFGIWVAGNILTTLYMLPDMAKISRWRVPSFSLSYIRQTLGYGAKSYLANVMMVINYRLDLFIIAGFLPFSQVGLYTTAVTLAEMVGYVGNAVNTALIPKLASGKDNLTFSMTPKVARLTILLTFLAALGMAVIGYPLIVLFFGARFSGAFYPLLLLLPGVVALGGSAVLSGDLMARGKPIYTSITSGITVVVTLILDFTLIPLWGITGASIASSLVYLSLFTLNYTFYRRESGEKLKAVVIFTREDIKEMTLFVKQVRNKWVSRGRAVQDGKK